MKKSSSLLFRLPSIVATLVAGLFLPLAGAAQTLIDLDTNFEGRTFTDEQPGPDQYFLSQSQHAALSAGDLNGDGQQDLVIGAGGRIELPAPSITVDGKVLVQFGPLAVCGRTDISEPEQSDVVITGADFQDALGWTTLVADLNSDGQDDLLVTSPKADGPTDSRPDVGAVYAFFGPLSAGTLDIQTDADWVVHGDHADEPLAGGLAVGDLNQDGVADLVIGAPGSVVTVLGRTHVLFGPFAPGGSHDLAVTPADLVIEGLQPRDQMGSALAIADLSGDGVADLALAGSNASQNPFLILQGEAYVFFGPLAAGELDATAADFTAEGTTNVQDFGVGLEVADFDDDGQLDLAVAAGQLPNPLLGTRSGGASIYFGPLTTGTSTTSLGADLVVFASRPGQVFDITAGDVSGDGIADLILGSPTKDLDGRSVAGEVEVVFGPMAPGVLNLTSTEADLRVWGKDASGQLGRGATVADLSGDGVDNLVLSASFVPQFTSSGEVYLFDGPHGFPVSADTTAACVAASPLSLSGSADSDVAIDSVTATVNGNTVGTVCLGCGIDPAFSFEFPLQACDNTLRFEALDATGQGGAVTRKTRLDAEGPEFDASCGDIEVEVAEGAGGANVAFDPSAADNCDGSMAADCSIASGSFFPLGVTEVSCSATDTCGNKSTCNFRVIVETETTDSVECQVDEFDQATVSPLFSLDSLGDAGLENADIEAGELHLTGTGSSLYHGAEDNTVFLHQNHNGDFFVEVEVTGIPVDQGDAYRKGGLMIRDDLSDDGPRLMAQVVPDFNGSGENALLFDYRDENGNAFALASTEQGIELPVKLGFSRRGNEFTVYYAAADGGWVRPLGGAGGTVTLDLSETALVGMNVASYDPAVAMTMAFDDFTICSPNEIDSPPVDVGCDLSKPLDVVFLMDLSGSMARDFDGTSKLQAARQAIHRLNDSFRTLGDGSRGALITYSFTAGDTQVADATEVLAGFTDDFDSLSAAVDGLNFAEVLPLDASPSALAVDAVTELLQSSGDPQHRPVVIWLTDNLPNVDRDLFGPVHYQESEVRALSIVDPVGGGFLDRGLVSFLGQANTPVGPPAVQFFDGKVLADAMESIERLSETFEETRILSAVPRDDGSTSSPISEQLLDYAAYHAGGGVFGGTHLNGLIEAMNELLEAAYCDNPGNAAIDGLLWRDLNADGVRQAGEPGVGGVEVELLDAASTVLAVAETGTAGDYGFASVPPGTYQVRVVPSSLPSELTVPTFDADGVGTAGRFAVNLASFDVVQGDFGYDETVADVDPLAACFVDDFEDGILAGEWQSTFLGNASSGSLVESDGSLRISGNGTSLYTTDNAHYLYQHVNGDFRMEVDIETLPVNQGNQFRKTGAMVRDGFGSTAPRLMVQYGPDWPNSQGAILQFVYRAVEGGPQSAVWPRIQNVQLPVRVAIERQGNSFSVEYSTDGAVTWQQPSGPAAVTLPWSSVLQVGLDSVSYHPVLEMTAEMDNFSLCPVNP